MVFWTSQKAVVVQAWDYLTVVVAAAVDVLEPKICECALHLFFQDTGFVP